MPSAAAVSAEPLWMRTLRTRAREQFQSLKWPTTAEEEWRRTDLSRVPLDSFAPVKPAAPSCPADVERGAASGLLRFQSARCLESALDPRLYEAGVRLLPLDNALEEFEAPLHSLYQKALAEIDNRFLAWHYAEWSHGALLWVPAGLEITEPFLIDFQEDGDGIMSAPHLAVFLGVGARASVVQRISSRGGAAGGAGLLCNAVVDVRLGDASALQLWEQQELAPGDIYIRHAQAEVGRDASLRHFDAEFGSRLAKSRVDCALGGTGAEAFLDGAYYCRKGQHMDLRTVQRHRSPKAMSRAVYKGAVDGGGRTVYQGLIEVSPGAAGTDAWLTNRNLVLGEAARADSIPTLKIGNNDVKCSHGSTTGKLNAEELFYLQSRGLSAAAAREMLVIGYFEDMLTAAPEAFRESTLDTIRGRLRVA
ncbi:MAG TPA: SufD family Fe-S cluster assembly protein [Spirochaetia bacterium]|nr:SufD family Fe-S cluster assembly protein [Spirochaetia bacterium]